MPLIIGLTGEKLSGKGAASDYLSLKYRAKHYRFSLILDDIASRLYLPKTRDNLIDIALALRSKFGNEILAHVLKKDIENEKPDICIVDGMRYFEEYNILSTLSNFYLISITAPLEVRYQRALERQEKVDEINMSLDDFKKQEMAATEIAITELNKKADFQINNTGDVSELHTKIDEIMNDLNTKIKINAGN
ncbi:MAG: hypothetical protein V1898_04080 [Patescibacteria group bacterium]